MTIRGPDLAADLVIEKGRPRGASRFLRYAKFSFFLLAMGRKTSYQCSASCSKPA
jgi:hypothetical protein